MRAAVGAEPVNINDRIALADLVHAYAAAVDDRRFDDAAELFSATGDLVLPDPPQFLEPIRHHAGRAAIRTGLASVAAVPRTEHAIVGEVYWPGGTVDEAHGRITCVAHHWSRRGSERDGEFTDLVWHVRYNDRYVRTESGWRVAARALTINAIETRQVRRVR
jgi:SnoaL-like domain